MACALAGGCDGVLQIEAVPPAGSNTGSGGGARFLHAFSAKADPLPTLGLTLDTQTPVPPAVGDTVLVFVATFWNTPTAVTDSAGNSYTSGPIIPRSLGGSAIQVFYANVASSADPFTIHVDTVEDSSHPGKNELSIAYHEYANATTIEAGPGSNGDGSMQTQPFAGDCGTFAGAAARTLYVAAVTGDFTGKMTGNMGYNNRTNPAFDHTMFAVVMSSDILVTQTPFDVTFKATLSTGAPTWACAPVQLY